MFSDYRLQVCEITLNDHPPKGHDVTAQRLDVTKAENAEAVVLVHFRGKPSRRDGSKEILDQLGIEPKGKGLRELVSWDVFDVDLSSGDIIGYLEFKTAQAAEDFGARQEAARLRRARVIRDYGMFRREEAPQYYVLGGLAGLNQMHCIMETDEQDMSIDTGMT